MRALLLPLAVIAAGCAGQKDSQRPASYPTPIVRETPRLSERLRVRRQDAALRDGQAMTEVAGAISR